MSNEEVYKERCMDMVNKIGALERQITVMITQLERLREANEMLKQSKFSISKVILTGPRNMHPQQLMVSRVDPTPAGVIVWVMR